MRHFTLEVSSTEPKQATPAKLSKVRALMDIIEYESSHATHNEIELYRSADLNQSGSQISLNQTQLHP